MRKILSIFLVLGLMFITTFAFADSKFNQNFTEPTFSPRIVVSKTAAYTATATDDEIKVSTASGGVTITLPSISGLASSGLGTKAFKIKKTTADNNIVTISPASGNTIDGTTAYVLTHNDDFVLIASQTGSSNWQIDYSSNIMNCSVTTGICTAGLGVVAYGGSAFAGHTISVVAITTTVVSSTGAVGTSPTSTTITIPTGQFDTAGETLKWHIVGSMSGDNGAKGFAVNLGGNDYFSITTTEEATGNYQLNCWLTALGPAKQKGGCLFIQDATNTKLTVDSNLTVDLSSGGIAKITLRPTDASDAVSATYEELLYLK